MPQYLTQTEAARALGTDVRTIRRYISAGHLPAYRLGARAIRIKPSDLDALLVRIPTA